MSSPREQSAMEPSPILLASLLEKKNNILVNENNMVMEALLESREYNRQHLLHIQKLKNDNQKLVVCSDKLKLIAELEKAKATRFFEFIQKVNTICKYPPIQESDELQSLMKYLRDAVHRDTVKFLSPLSVTHGFNATSAPYGCHCGIVLDSPELLNNHIQRMTQEWKFMCSNCNRYFFLEEELRLHLSLYVPPTVENENHKFICELCGMRFYNLQLLKSHQESVHQVTAPMAEYTVGCNICGSMFRDPAQFSLHVNTHHSEPPLIDLTSVPDT